MCQTARTPIPCFRFNPLLEEEVSSSEINEKKIVEMILKTKLYLGQKVNYNYYLFFIFIALLLLGNERKTR